MFLNTSLPDSFLFQNLHKVFGAISLAKSFDWLETRFFFGKLLDSGQNFILFMTMINDTFNIQSPISLPGTNINSGNAKIGRLANSRTRIANNKVSIL